MITIAETAWHHDGDFDFMNNLVSQILEKTEAEFIKIHISLDVDEYMTKDHPGYNAVVGKNVYRRTMVANCKSDS
jgi:sialic acid synthase SpsE